MTSMLHAVSRWSRWPDVGEAPGLLDGGAQVARRLLGSPPTTGCRRPSRRACLPAAPAFHPSASAYVYGTASAFAALVLAWLGLYHRRLPNALRRTAARVAGVPLRRLELLHDGVVGDYVTWLTAGAAVLGALFAVLIR